VICPSNRVRIMVATKPIDFRKGHDSLAAMVKNELRKHPFTGTAFVFRARKADRLKLLYWDGTARPCRIEPMMGNLCAPFFAHTAHDTLFGFACPW
jgi:transposase